MICFTTHSDDCANCTVNGRPVGLTDEAWGVWAPVTVNGHRVADVRVDYGDGWEFKLRAVPGQTITVDLPDRHDPDAGTDNEDDVAEDRHPAVTAALQRLNATSTPGGRIPRVADEVEVLAAVVTSRIGDCPELVTALERLAEARDLLVAAYYAPDPTDDDPRWDRTWAAAVARTTGDETSGLLRAQASAAEMFVAGMVCRTHGVGTPVQVDGGGPAIWRVAPADQQELGSDRIVVVNRANPGYTLRLRPEDLIYVGQAPLVAGERVYNSAGDTWGTVTAVNGSDERSRFTVRWDDGAEVDHRPGELERPPDVAARWGVHRRVTLRRQSDLRGRIVGVLAETVAVSWSPHTGEPTWHTVQDVALAED